MKLWSPPKKKSSLAIEQQNGEWNVKHNYKKKGKKEKKSAPAKVLFTLEVM